MVKKENILKYKVKKNVRFTVEKFWIAIPHEHGPNVNLELKKFNGD